jgi:hypothetical protein
MHNTPVLLPPQQYRPVLFIWRLDSEHQVELARYTLAANVAQTRLDALRHSLALKHGVTPSRIIVVR